MTRNVSLRLDESDISNLQDGKIENYPRDEYVQLYVPYDYFEKACKMIKSVYSSDNNYVGYHNYMKYWARNGGPDWICNTEEYAGYTGDKVVVKNTYLVTNFWNYYDGTKSPVRGENYLYGVKANGW